MASVQLTIQDFIKGAQMLGEQAFVKKHDAPMLLGREVLEEEFSFATAVANINDPELDRPNHSMRIRDWVLPIKRPEGASTTSSLRVFIGRASNNDLSVPHPTISKLHAYFCYERDRWWLIDVGSSNGTSVNGLKAPARAKTGLQDKDVIILGRCSFSFLLPHSFYRLVAGMASAIRPV